jgi:outer membrane lipoprotein-sorting protein
MKSTGGSQPAQNVEATFYIKGRNLRSEMATPTGKAIQIVNSKGLFMLLPGSKEAMKIPVPPNASGANPGKPFDDIDKIKRNKKVGAEKVAGYQTDIYEERNVISPPGRPKLTFSTRYWIASGLHVPVKMVRTHPNGQVMTMILKSADMKASVSDSLFVLPKGTTVREMPGRPGSPPPSPK